MKKSTMYIAHASIIAALYATLTIGQNLLLPGTASMTVQFRLSEVLTTLAFFTPAAIPGLTVGCIVANITSFTAGLGLYDMFFGSLASLLAALCMYLLRNLKWKNVPLVGLLMPAVFNGLLVGFEIDFFFVDGLGFNFPDFLLQGSFVALGELLVLFVLGIPFVMYLNNSKLFNKLI